MVRGASRRVRRRDGESLRPGRGARRVAGDGQQIEDWKPHIGRKVSVRYRLHDGEHPFSEAIGVLMQVGADPDGGQLLTILARRGETKEIRTRDLVAAKLFPLGR